MILASFSDRNTSLYQAVPKGINIIYERTMKEMGMFMLPSLVQSII
jgi:hypothetical protein